jgi:hypothetical protein
VKLDRIRRKSLTTVASSKWPRPPSCGEGLLGPLIPQIPRGRGLFPPRTRLMAPDRCGLGEDGPSRSWSSPCGRRDGSGLLGVEGAGSEPPRRAGRFKNSFLLRPVDEPKGSAGCGLEHQGADIDRGLGGEPEFGWNPRHFGGVLLTCPRSWSLVPAGFSPRWQ